MAVTINPRYETCTHINEFAEYFNIAGPVWNGVDVSCFDIFPYQYCDHPWQQYPWQSGVQQVSREDVARAIHSAERDIERLCIDGKLCDTEVTEEIELTNKEVAAFRRGESVPISLGNKYFKRIGGYTHTQISSKAFPTELIVDPASTPPVYVNVAIPKNFLDALSDTCIMYLVPVGLFSTEKPLSDHYVHRMPEPFEITEDTLEMNYKYNLWDMLDTGLVKRLPTVGQNGSVENEHQELCDATQIIGGLIGISRDFEECPTDAIQIYSREVGGCYPNCDEVVTSGCVIKSSKSVPRIWVQQGSWKTEEPAPDPNDPPIPVCEFTPHRRDHCDHNIPFRIKVRYIAGCKETPDGPCNATCYTEEIMMLAAARLRGKICHCFCDLGALEDLRKDVALAEQGSVHRIVTDDLRNPLGTRRGEVDAWKKLKVIGKDVEFAALL